MFLKRGSFKELELSYHFRWISLILSMFIKLILTEKRLEMVSIFHGESYIETVHHLEHFLTPSFFKSPLAKCYRFFFHHPLCRNDLATNFCIPFRKCYKFLVLNHNLWNFSKRMLFLSICKCMGKFSLIFSHLIRACLR